MQMGLLNIRQKMPEPLKLTAEKDGYTTANKNINVIPPKEEMTLNISPETVYVGDTSI